MKHRIVSLFLSLVSLHLGAQQPRYETMELVKTFPLGSGSGQLGIIRPDVDYDGPSAAASILALRSGWLIDDNVNACIVVLDEAWNEISRKGIRRRDYLNIATVDNGILLWSSTGYGRKFGGSPFWISSDFNTLTSVDKGLLEFASSSQDYSLLLQFQDVLIFQNHRTYQGSEEPSLFGIRGLASKTETQQQYLNDSKVRTFLADRTNTRYRAAGNLVWDGDQAITSDGETLTSTFQQLGAQISPSDRIGDTDTVSALANGNYWFATSFAFSIRDNRGGEIVSLKVASEPLEGLVYSRLFPAADGYIYQLIGDYGAEETRLCRIGPFPELKLDFHGLGGAINDDNVNLREASSTDSPVVTKLSKGTPVRVLAQTDKEETIAGQKAVWYHVRLWDRTEGWVFGQFLDIQK